MLVGEASQFDVGLSQTAAARMTEVGRELQQKYGQAIAHGIEPPGLEQLNMSLVYAERALRYPRGYLGGHGTNMLYSPRAFILPTHPCLFLLWR